MLKKQIQNPIIPQDYETNDKVYSSLPLPFAKFDLLSLFQRDKVPPDKGVIEGVHIRGDERTPPIHLGNTNIAQGFHCSKKIIWKLILL